MKIKICVTTHPARKDTLGNLLAQINDACDAEVFCDENSNGTWWNAKRAYESFDAERYSHLIIIQDDVKLAKGFIGSCEAIARALPYNPVGFYLSRRSVVDEARKSGLNYVVLGDFCAGPANMIPAMYVKQFLAWEDGKFHTKRFCDLRLGLFFACNKISFYCTVPSIVEHLGSKKSLTHKGAFGNQVAKWYVGDERDASEINWPNTAHLHRKGNWKQWVYVNVPEVAQEFADAVRSGKYD